MEGMVEPGGETSNPEGSLGEQPPAALARKRLSGREEALWKLVGLRGHFSSPEALIEALEEMEKVLTRDDASTPPPLKSLAPKN
jgi:hypothetical protein